MVRLVGRRLVVVFVLVRFSPPTNSMDSTEPLVCVASWGLRGPHVSWLHPSAAEALLALQVPHTAVCGKIYPAFFAVSVACVVYVGGWRVVVIVALLVCPCVLAFPRVLLTARLGGVGTDGCCARFVRQECRGVA